MKILGQLFCSGLLVGALFGCQSQESTPESASWPEKMQGMSKSVTSLLPYVYSRKEFHDPENEKALKSMIKDFSGAVHEVPAEAGKKIIGEDPIIKYSLDRLQDDVDRATKSFASGHKEYARSILRGTMSNCFSCHSRTQVGPEYVVSDSVFKNRQIEATERADLYVATRQYQKALEALSKVLNEPVSFYEDPYEHERALKKYLAISVRVKKDPTAAIATIDKFLTRKNVPYYLSEDARSWRKSLSDWAKEKTAPSNKLKKAESLIKEARQLQSLHSFQTGNIEYLRATSLLHEQLAETKDPAERSKIYSLLGKSYEILADLGFWNFPELYFEACIRETPKTNMAKSCYKDFEKNVIFGFSGSAGIFLPTEERNRLKQLKELA
ncbi:MAG: hypothetical protein KDD59_14170, partial [Bdellovibrionales bacterium]|nr:hypothetical protein [Bdellovibrionales bacterium]